MPTITTPPVELFYETRGDPAHPPVLLIMGLGAQMTLWPEEFVDALVSRGHYVIRFDNRDIGLSQSSMAQRCPASSGSFFANARLACARAIHPWRYGR